MCIGAGYIVQFKEANDFSIEKYYDAFGVNLSAAEARFDLIVPQIWLVIQLQLEKQDYCCVNSSSMSCPAVNDTETGVTTVHHIRFEKLLPKPEIAMLESMVKPPL